MSHTPHELHDEFPSHAAQITRLRASDAHFARLADDYHQVNRAVHRAETDTAPTDDAHVGQLRRQRMRLKDQIWAILSKAD